MPEAGRSVEEIAGEFGVDLKTARQLKSQLSAKSWAVGPRVPNPFELALLTANRFILRARQNPWLSLLLFALCLAIVVALEYHAGIQIRGKPVTPWLAQWQPWYGPIESVLIVVIFPALSAALGNSKWILIGACLVSALATLAVILSDLLFYGPYPFGLAFFAAYCWFGIACMLTGFAGLMFAVLIAQRQRQKNLDRLSALTRLRQLRQLADSEDLSTKELPLSWIAAVAGGVAMGYGYVFAGVQPFAGAGAIVLAILVALAARSWQEAMGSSLVGSSLIFLICLTGIKPELRGLIPGFVLLSVIFAAGAFAAAGGVPAAQKRLIDTGNRVAIIREILRLEEQVLDAKLRTSCIMVVDASKSAEMKLGADPLIAELAFRQYQAWLDERVAPFGGSILSRPGDGAIFSFNESSAAFEAARAVLADLDRFNSDRNQLGKPFRLRIGLHSGEVRGKVVDVQFTAIIDVAAHVEARAELNGVAITQPCLDELSSSIESRLAGEVDGFSVYLWKPPTPAAVS
jgi:class 3 adenylate cyclase